MTSSPARVLAFVLVMVLMISSHVAAQETSQVQDPPSDHTEKQAFSPHVADIIPLASELTIRLSSLESEIQDIPDPSKAAKKFEEIQAKTDEFVIEFQRLKDAKHSNSR